MNQGKTIGHYKIIRPLGKGGMGEVYLAEDTKLQREVALKFLPEAVRNDSDRLARFRREALAAAKLKHPNIATIYALEDLDDQMFIAMEYVEGETLASHIPNDGMELDKFSDIFLPLADGLAHAHSQGRIHRDLKPGNIMIAADGTPKILDFGLARIEQGENASAEMDSDAPTRTMKADEMDAPPSLTQGKSFLGTPAYMSPEQIEGKKVDTRTDIFSFGVVMYEASTGQRPFKGDTVESIIARILESEPEPVTNMKSITPHTLWRTLHGCLEKDREQRIPTARRLHKELSDTAEEIRSGIILIDAAHPSIRQSSQSSIPLRPVTAIVATLLVIAITATLAWFLKPMPSPRPRMLNLQIDALATPWDGPVISPDGTMIAYSIHNDDALRIYNIVDGIDIELAGTEGTQRPFWSPDSRMIGYFENAAQISEGNMIRAVSVNGGPTTPVAKMPGLSFSRGAVWQQDGTIIFGATTDFADRGSGLLYAVASEGGTPEVFLAPDTTQGEHGILFPFLMPDNILGFCAVDTAGTSSLVILNGGEKIELISHPSEVLAFATYSTTGHIIYEREFDVANQNSIWRLSMDGIQPVGSPNLLFDDGHLPSVSADGALLFSTVLGRVGGLSRLVWLDRRGQIIETINKDRFVNGFPVLSPDGRHIAVPAFDDKMDILIFDVNRATVSRLTRDTAYDMFPAWSSDGKRIFFTSHKSGNGDIYSRASDGTGSSELLLGGPGQQLPLSWSGDGRYLIYAEEISGRVSLSYLDKTNGKSTKMFGTEYQTHHGILSPDGRYLAFASDESGRFELYIVNFPSLSGKIQVSIGGGLGPRWRRDEKELYYISNDSLMVVSVQTDPILKMGTPNALFESSSLARGYDIAPNGQRFIGRQMTESVGSANRVTLVQDWAARLRK
jgi:eukaryotic-like serine/threonine-protein kinase